MEKDILYKFFEGTATDNEISVVRQWVDSSDENQKELFKERKLYDAIILNHDLISGTETPEKKKSVNFTFRLKEVAKIAAAILITTFAFSLYNYLDKKSQDKILQTISVPAGQRTNIILPDGTNVWLNARTTLCYSSNFGIDNRTLKLDGEAYFDVTSNKDLPFIVESPKGTVKVLGTQFNLMDYSENHYYETALMEGKLELDITSVNKKVGLSSGNKATLVNNGIEIAKVEDFDPYRWREGLICFKDQTFDTIMKDFEKYYGIQILTCRDNIKSLRYTGKFRQTDGVNYALHVLKRDIHFEFEKDDEKNIIYIR